MRTLKALSGLLLFIYLPSIGLADVKDDARFVVQTLEEINNSPFDHTCGAAVESSEECSHLFEMFERDRGTGFFFGAIGESPWDACKEQVPSHEYISVGQLEKRFSKDTRVSLGVKDDYFSNMARKCFPRKRDEGERQQKAIITMGYSYLNRIQESTGALSKEIMNLNSLMGEPLDKDLPCESFSMPKDAAICQQIKRGDCSANNDLDVYAGTLSENVVEPYVALKLAREKLWIGQGRSQRNRARIEDLDNKIKYLERENPILKGKLFSKFLKREGVSKGKAPSTRAVSAALREQFSQNRSLLKEKLEENINLNKCVVYGGDEYCDDFDKNMKRIPPHESLAFFEPTEANKRASALEDLAVEQYYNSVSCIDEFRGLKNEFNSFAGGLALDVGLTLFTGGTALLIKAGAQGTRAAVAAHRVALAADTAYLGVGVEEAVEVCSEELNKLEHNESDNSEQNFCPRAVSAPEIEVVANYQGCVTGAMMASLNALPFVPAVVSKYTRKAADAKLAEYAKSLPKSFGAPRKAFDPHDLRFAGKVFPRGKKLKPGEVFDRDGVYVYIVDDKGNMVISHRAPDLKADIGVDDQFLGTHRGLYNTLNSNQAGGEVVAAGEIRVVGGHPITVNPRAGSFHTTHSDVLEDMARNGDEIQKKNVAALRREIDDLPEHAKDNMFIMEMELEDILTDRPEVMEAFNQMKKQLDEVTTDRLGVAQDAMKSRGLLSDNVPTKFDKNIAGDAHIEGRAAAVAEINCRKDSGCVKELMAYQKTAKRFLEKYKTPKDSEEAVLKTVDFSKTEFNTQQEKAFQFFGERSNLLFKEGPIEFMENAKPDSFGLSREEALEHLPQWLEQFD